MDIKFVAATQTPELVKQVLGSANKVTNEYDLWITFTLCVTAIIIIGLICLTIVSTQFWAYHHFKALFQCL